MKEKAGRVLNFIQELLQILMSHGAVVYMVLMMVMLPLYFEQGYGYIATDKAGFFCNVGVNIGKVLLPLFILYAITTIAVNHAKNRNFFGNDLEKNLVKQSICKISAVDFFVGLYGLALILSYACSDYKADALWGTSGWYMGLCPQLIWIGSYFLIAKFWIPGKWMFYLLFPVGLVVFVLGYLNRFGYYPIEMEYASASYISTIGNINWYCGYVVPVLFAGVGVLWKFPRKEKRIAENNGETAQKGRVFLRGAAYVSLCIFVLVGFATLITQGSASGILALGVMMLCLFYLSVKDGRSMLQFWVIAGLASLACVVTMAVRLKFPGAITFSDPFVDLLTTGWIPIALTLVSFVGMIGSVKWNRVNVKIWKRTAILCVTLVSCILVVYVLLLTVNTIYPGSIGKLSEYEVFTFTGSWGSNRGATWRAAVMCFGEQDFLHKLVGVGPDAMWVYIMTDGSGELTGMIKDTFGNLRLTNAHNEWLNILVNMGLLGVISFVGIIVSAIVTFFKEKETGIPIACALGILAHTFNNIFSFQQVLNMTVLFLLLGMGSAISATRRSGAGFPEQSSHVPVSEPGCREDMPD